MANDLGQRIRGRAPAVTGSNRASRLVAGFRHLGADSCVLFTNLEGKLGPNSAGDLYTDSALFLGLRFMSRVIVCAHEVQRNVRLVAYHPAIVAGLNIEDVARLHLDHPAIVHCGSRSP